MRTPLALLIALALPGGTRVDELVYRPAPGATLVRTIEQESSQELETLKVTMDGEELPPEFLETVRMQLGTHARYTITDVIESVSEGRPHRLVRTFDELTMGDTSHTNGPDGEQSRTGEYESALEGQSVLFAWNAEDDDYDVSFREGSHGDAALLAGLDVELDLREFLPPGPVAPGAEWEVDVAAFRPMMEPGGDLHLLDPKDEAAGAARDHAREQRQRASLREHLAGTIHARYRGTRVEAARRLAVIDLAVEAGSDDEQTDVGPAGDVPEGMTGTTRTELGFALKGELVWDLEHGHAHTFRLAGENRVTLSQVLSGAMEGETFEQVQTMAFRGTMTFSVQVERR